MRVASILSIGLCCAAFALPASAGALTPPPGPGELQAIVRIADVCPPGSQWVDAGYGRKGEWQIAHCSTWVGGGPATYQGGPGWRLERYGQPSPIAGIPGGDQPSASSHPPEPFMQH